MPFVTHFKDTDGKQLPIAASTLVTVEIPAAGSADKGGWMQAAQDTTEHYNQQAGHDAPKHSAVIPSCTDPSVFTNNGLRIEYEEQLQGWVLWIDSLPETACTLTLLFINHSTEDTPVVLPALGRGGGGGDVIISLNECGIDLIAFMVLGGGVQNFTGEAPSRLFVLIGEALAAGKIPTFKNEFEYVGNEVMYLNPLYVSDSRLAFKVALAFDGLMEATAYLGKVSGGVEVTAFVETHSIS